MRFMIRNTDTKYQALVSRLEELRREARELAVHVATEFGTISGVIQIADGDEEIKALADGRVVFRGYDDGGFSEVADEQLSLTRLGALLDSSATNLGLWHNG